MPRLFAALEIPHDAVLSLSLLRGGLPGARWVDEADYHLTLRFFGDVAGPMADEIVQALDRLAGQSFSLRLKGIDVFTPKKPHLLYAGVEACPALETLQADMERISRKLGLKPGKKSFTPHVTIARLKQVRLDDLVKYLSSRGNFTTNDFAVTRFVLMSAKELVGGGPYVVEEHWPLDPARLHSNTDSPKLPG